MVDREDSACPECGYYLIETVYVVEAMEGVEHIRARPSMYIPDTGKEGLHHIVWELVDNAVDEHMAGHCNALSVELDSKKQLVTVTDDGRGIPVEKHPQTGKPTIEGIFTRTMMGGKFGKQAYAISGGLHGVGAKATCALSDRMEVETVRKGFRYRVEFCRGSVTKSTKKVGKAKREHTGTSVTFHPDKDIFGRNVYDADRFRERLTAIAYLCPGLTVRLTINGKVTDLTSRDGLAGYLQSRLGRKEEAVMEEPVTFRVYGEFKDRKFVPHQKRRSDSEAIDVAIWWTDGDGEGWWSWVNMIPVKDGGTHVTGAKRAITRILSGYCDTDGVSGDDFREGLRVAVHVMLKEPHFEGQAKNRLNNPECAGMADTTFTKHFARWAAVNGDVVEALVSRAEALYKARKAYKAAKSVATQTAYADKGGRKGLPPVLATALRCKPEERELFIVEGASAGGNAVRGRNRNTNGHLFQEVLPLKGKPPNPVRSGEDLNRIAKLFNNAEYENIVRSIGAGHDLTQAGEACEPSKSRVAKVIIMADADADGGHIGTLLLAFFLRFLYPLVEQGMLWVALPPLFTAKWPKGRVFGDTLEEVKKAAAAKGYRGKLTITRLKGLGEMQPVELAMTSMEPTTRRLVRIEADRESVKYIMDLLGSEVSVRKDLLGLL